MSDSSSVLQQKHRRLRARDLLFLIPVAFGLAYIAAPEWWTPWAHFTGGSFHAAPWWSGAGSFEGPDGTYQLYLFLGPVDTGAHPTLTTHLVGDGHLCTPSGERLILHVTGDMDRHLPLNTLGRSIDIGSFTRSKPGSFSGMKAARSPYVRLTGVWGPGSIEAKGTLEHEPADPGHPRPPKAVPIAVTLQQAGEWWSPSCPAH